MIIEISSVCLPSSWGVERAIPLGVKVNQDHFYDGYDRSTLFYDCFFDADEKKIKIYAPSFLNFESHLKRFIPASEHGLPLRWVIKKHRCFDVIEISVKVPPSALQVSFGDWKQSFKVQTDVRGMFAGAKVLCAVNKNNELKWIVDWVIYHQCNHGIEAVLIFDNGSNLYTMEELSAALSAVVGGDHVAVVSAPLPYGPSKGTGSGLGRAKFFQTAMLNLARDRFLARASGVLSIDIDELVVSRGEGDVFDALEKSWLGFILLDGYWRYPSSVLRRSHGEHFWQSSRNDDCPAKYCYRPGRGFGRFAVGVHGSLLFSRRLIPSVDTHYFAHCKFITTGWKRTSRTLPEDMVVDSELARSLTAAGLIEVD